MRFSTILAAVNIALGVQAAVVWDVAAECGALGVFSPSSLPEGVDPNAVRKCLQHPLRNSTVASPQLLERRACFFSDQQYGCSHGFCWKQCGTAGEGEWCFQALNGGVGAWKTCVINEDCAPDGTSADCSIAGTAGGCSECGCSCH